MKQLRLGKDSWLYIIILFVTILTGVLLFSANNDQRDDAVLIDIAGRQRMLSQRIGLLANQIARGNTNTIPILEQHITLFENSLNILEFGGDVRTIGMEQDIEAHPAPNTVLPKITNLRNTWVLYQDLLDAVTQDTLNNYEPTLDTIDTVASEVLQKSDAVVKAFVNHTESSQGARSIVLLTLLALISIVIVVGLLLIGIEAKSAHTVTQNTNT